MVRALVRGKEIMIEPFNPWVKANIAFLTGQETSIDGKPINGDGWTLIEEYEPPQEDIKDEGN